MEFIIALIIFWFLYMLNSRVDALQKELSELKRNRAPEVSTVEAPLPQKAPLSVQKEALHVTPQPRKIESKKIEPSITKLSPLLLAIQNYFKQVNIVVHIGGVVVFFGLAFLVKYAAEHNVISIELRLIAVALTALALAAVGWRLRERENYYGLILQGIGIAIFYLVVFAAAKMYALLPVTMAFGIMLLLVIAGAALAIKQNALPLALFAITGGFLVPILLSDGSGSHVILFGYYALLNFGIVTIAWYRSWRLLNLTGFFFTFFIAVAWGVLRYSPELLSTTEPFLIFFFLLYLAVSILFTFRHEFNPRGMIDATLVFGLPLVAFSLQASLMHNIEYALAWSAVVLGSLYLILYRVLSRYEKMQMLREAFLALGVVFFTIAIPYAFSDKVSAPLWALEGAAILWVSLRQEQHYARVFAQGLQIVATAWYVISSLSFHAPTPFLNSGYLGFMIIVAALMFSAFLLYMYSPKRPYLNKDNATAFLYTAIGLWLYSGWIEAEKFTLPTGNVMLLYLAFGAFVFAMIAKRFDWSSLSKLLESYLIAGIIMLVTLLGHYGHTHPFEGIGSIALVLFFGMHYMMLYWFEKTWQQQTYLHAIGLWLILLIGAAEFSYVISLLTSNTTYKEAGWIVPILAVALVIMRKEKVLPSCFASYQQSYKNLGVGGLMLIVTFWELSAFSLSGNPAPLGYLPFLNPLDATQSAALVLMYLWIRTQPWQEPRIIYGVSALMALALGTVVLSRSIHFYVGVDYSIAALAHSMIFQSALSVLWSMIAMATIALAKIRRQRELWIVGAGLMGIVVLKLFMVELSSSGTIERYTATKNQDSDLKGHLPKCYNLQSI